MAEFWDTHDLTDFEAELIEAGELIFKHIGEHRPDRFRKTCQVSTAVNASE